MRARGCGETAYKGCLINVCSSKIGGGRGVAAAGRLRTWGPGVGGKDICGPAGHQAKKKKKERK